MDLDLMMNPVNRGAFGVFARAWTASVASRNAVRHWNVPGAGDSPEEVLAPGAGWQPVAVTGTPHSMGYVMGIHQGVGASWQEEERWRAARDPRAAAGSEDPEGDNDNEPECCLRHPGDKPADDFDAPEPGDEDGWSNDRFAALTTKAAEQVYSIHLCAPLAAAAAHAAGAGTIHEGGGVIEPHPAFVWMENPYIGSGQHAAG
jgi:hypothetical protein